MSTYISLEAVNRIAPVKKLALYFKAGIVGAVFLGARYDLFQIILLELDQEHIIQEAFNNN